MSINRFLLVFLRNEYFHYYNIQCFFYFIFFYSEFLNIFSKEKHNFEHLILVLIILFIFNAILHFFMASTEMITNYVKAVRLEKFKEVYVAFYFFFQFLYLNN